MSHVLVNELRKAVVQSAIEGKLTNRLLTDSLIYDNITKIEKEIDDLKKRKKWKSIKIIKNEKIPFVIPEEWVWVKLGDIIRIESGDGLISNKMTGSGYPVYGGNGINGYHDVYNINESHIVIGRVGAKCGCVHITEKYAWVTDNAFIVTYPKNSINKGYLVLCLKAFNLGTKSNSTAQPVISGQNLYPINLPLPPIEEQARIVARVDELMAKIDEYEKLEKELVELKKNFPGDIKAAVLQAAMQGKLTEQLESDSSVFEYMRNVLSLKNELIKKKEIKKDKTTPVKDEEAPFEIPDNWVWVKLGNIATLRSGKTPPRAEPIWWGKNDEIPWVSIADMVSNGTVTKTKEFISKDGFEQKFNSVISPAGTMIMSFKLTIGRMSILGMDALHNEAIISIFPFIDEDKTLQKYLFKVLPFLTQYGNSKNAIKGKTLNSDSLCNLYVPLPPIEEQKRIVEKLDKIIPLCEALENETV